MPARKMNYPANVRWVGFHKPRKPTFLERVVDIDASLRAVIASGGLGVILWGLLHLVKGWFGV